MTGAAPDQRDGGRHGRDAVGTQAVLLVGGLGTRLRPLTYEAPKPLAPVANRPLVSYSLRMLKRGGVAEAVLASGYMHEMLAEAFAEQHPDLPRVRVAVEREALDTAGAVRNSLDFADAPFVAMNGDQIMDVDVAALLRSHVEREADVTIVVRRVADVGAYGLVQVADDGLVEAFLEKRPEDPTGKNLVNSGMYVFSPSALEAIPRGEAYSNETQLFPGLIDEGKRLVAFTMREDAYWADVGTPEKYLEANRSVLQGALPWIESASEAVEADVVEPVCIGAGCSISRDARIGPNVSIGAGVTLGAGVRISESVVWPSASIGEGCELENVIIGPDTWVPPGTVLRESGARILARDATEKDE